MARIFGARFKPFDYAQMVAPVERADMMHTQLQEQLGELSTKASVWENMANQQTDPKAYAQYKAYAADLSRQADLLAKQGLTPESKASLIKLKQRYTSDIVPIEQAYARRQALVDEQRKALLSDNTLMFDRAASSLSLDELMANPTLSPRAYSGTMLAKQVGSAAQNLSKDMMDNPRKWRSILGGQYFESLMQRGFRPNEVLQAVMNNPQASPILRNIVEETISSSGIPQWGDKETLQRAYDYARQGLWSAVGDTQYQIQSDKAYDFGMKAGLSGSGGDTSPNLTYRAIGRTGVDGTKKTTELQKDLDFLRELQKNPGLMNQTATRRVGVPDPDRLMGTRGNLTYSQYRDEEYKPNQERFRQIAQRYNIKTGDMISLQKAIQDDIAGSAVRDFVYKPNITQSDLISQVIKENAMTLAGSNQTTGLYELDDNRKGDPIKPKNLNKYFTKDTNLGYDPAVGIILYSTNDRDSYNAVIDPELIDDPDRTVKRNMDRINILLQEQRNQEASAEIENLMNYIYAKFNTLAKRQSNTDSKM